MSISNLKKNFDIKKKNFKKSMIKINTNIFVYNEFK